VAEGPDLGLGVGLPDERIVRRHAAVIAKTEDLALMCIRALCDGVVRTAHCHIEVPIGPERHRSPGWRSSARRISDKELLDINQRHAVQTTADKGRCVSLVTETFDVAQIDQTVVGELRMENDLQQSGQNRAVDSRNAGDRLRVQNAPTDDPQAARIPLGDQNVAVREKREAPRMRQAFHDRHADLRLGGLDEERSVR
jgi:hypothetical protein